MDTTHGQYKITDDASLLDVDAVHALLKETYWASERTRADVEKSLRHSIAVAALTPAGALVGCARAITDTAAVTWICDVVVAPSHRGRGVGKALLRRLLEHPDIVRTRKILVTKDAQGLYRGIGFETHKFECMVKYPEQPQHAVAGYASQARQS